MCYYKLFGLTYSLAYWCFSIKTSTCCHLYLFIANPCDALPSLTGGTIVPGNCTSGKVTPGQVCTVTCKQGYNFPGNPKLTCYGNGQWSNNGYPVTCKGILELSL